MINKTNLWQTDSDNPEQAVLNRLNDWRKENPGAVILGVQWIVGARDARCDVTFEVDDEPVDEISRTDRSIDLATRILDDSGDTDEPT